MSKRLYIVVEGDTEEQFVKEVLTPYFNTFEIYSVHATQITTNKRLGAKGGFVNYQHLKNDVLRLLKQQDVIVSMLVDFYRIPGSVPGYDQAMLQSTSIKKIEVLENAINDDINDHRFISYIQRHEFESVLFASDAGFQKYYNEPAQVLTRINSVIEQFPNPEDINDGPETAPSKRIIQIIPEYKKVVDGNILALEVGIDTILQKCPMFKAWIEKLLLAMR
ncbi:DUF4276 family protein [Cytophagaceae bacterium DM2B3-1]|uniref:DUF4276 family protein n=1 Tax=Xanthocytophaga flava TaxID=3048013 RepID=A0ABT7CD81_9BACT|nr:DUF4276 family protein [Xanthocytophaga flavus]MDJ1491670.1 DUF4276 family protein [Xanthocytophaga flavus]